LIYAAKARQQIADLIDHYERKLRPEATLAISEALSIAERQIAARPETGLSAPRPYPSLASDGEAWIKAGRYWITYSTTRPPVILAVIYDTADIPGRT